MFMKSCNNSSSLHNETVKGCVGECVCTVYREGGGGGGLKGGVLFFKLILISLLILIFLVSNRST